MRLLIRARLFLEHAVSHAASPSEIDPMIAIHGLDNTVEFLIRILATHLDFEAVSGKSFPESELAAMAGELNRFLTEQYRERLPYLSELKILRQTRNLVQHDAFSPQSDLAKHVVIVQRFFERALKLVFALDLNELKLSKIVTDPVVKERLADAEVARSAKDYLKAVVACRDAFDYALLVRGRLTDLKLQGVPTIARVDPKDSDTPRFYEAIQSEISSLALGLDSFQNGRFRDIVRHIPIEHCVEWHGNLVMQRAWEARDADFCYSFVTDNVLRWQAKDLAPLYQILPSDSEYATSYTVNGIKLKTHPNFGCTYFRETGWLELWCVTRQTKEHLRKIDLREVCTWESFGTNNDTPSHRAKFKCKIVHRRIGLVCNRPELWEVALEHMRVPFTYESWKYPNGVETSDSPSIGKSTAKEFTKLPKIDLKLANRLVSLREAAGKIRSEDDLRKIKGITEEQIWWLSQFTRP
jgi:hypothetical protein